MTAFVVLAAILTVAVLAAVLRPLWKQSRGVLVGAVLVLGLATLALYRIIGTPAGIGVAAQAADLPATLDEAIGQLRAELQRNPAQPEGWRLLGKSLATQQKYDEARDAFAQAAKLSPDDAELLTEAAQSRMYADPQRKLDDEASTLLQRALQVQPQNQRARWLMGVWQRQNGQPDAAAKTWEPLLAEVDADTAQTLRVQIDAARADAGLAPLPPSAASADTAPASDNAHAITVKVALDPDFAARVRLRGDASVFVIARVPGGPPMPVAVQKHSLQELPLTVTLSDGDSPMPTQKLSSLQRVEVFARLSSSGNPMRQEGDLDSNAVAIDLPAKAPVELLLGK